MFLRFRSFAIALLGLGAVLSPVGAEERGNSGAPPGMSRVGANEGGYEIFRNEKDGSTLILVPASTFKMGDDSAKGAEKPARQVELSAYMIGKTEVTWAQYGKFCTETKRPLPKRPEWATDGHPVANVTYADALAYCDWAGLRLPTEAEWERAARGTDGRLFPWGHTDPGAGGFAKYGEQRCYLKESDKFPRPAGAYPKGASPVGALDMAGSVAEFCSDWWDPTYYTEANKKGDNKDPKGPPKGDYRSVRGGAWCYDSSFLKTTNRFLFDPAGSFPGIGFRVAR